MQPQKILFFENNKMFPDFYQLDVFRKQHNQFNEKTEELKNNIFREERKEIIRVV